MSFINFINLAIDRVVAIAFPYRHKSIITYKRAYVMLTLTWIMSSIMCLVIYLPASFVFVGSLGVYTPMEKAIGQVILFVFLLVLSTILIVCVNVYLYVQVNKSKQKLENMRTHGTDGRNDYKENKQLERRYHKFQKQVKITMSLLVLGGVDGIINLLTI